MANTRKKNCGELVLTAGLLLGKYRTLIPQIMRLSSPNAAFQWVIKHHPPEGLSGKKITELARAAQSIKTIERDYPQELEHLARMFQIEL